MIFAVVNYQMFIPLYLINRFNPEWLLYATVRWGYLGNLSYYLSDIMYQEIEPDSVWPLPSTLSAPGLSLYPPLNPHKLLFIPHSFPAGASLRSQHGQVHISESLAVASLPVTVCGVRGSPSLPIPWETPRGLWFTAYEMVRQCNVFCSREFNWANTDK